jgi:hypothetical protein
VGWIDFRLEFGAELVIGLACALVPLGVRVSFRGLRARFFRRLLERAGDRIALSI